jgi:hypothetical protein
MKRHSIILLAVPFFVCFPDSMHGDPCQSYPPDPNVAAGPIANTYTPIPAKINGVTQTIWLYHAHDVWRVFHSNYPAGITTRCGRRFDHMVSAGLYTFPIVGTHPVGGNQWYEGTLQQVTVTSQAVNAVYSEQFPMSTILSPPTLSYNCHGLTTGRLIWIETSLTGIGRLYIDDFKYTPNTCDMRYYFRTQSGGERNHSYLANLGQFEFPAGSGNIVCYPASAIEKFNVGPIMLYPYTGTALWGTYNSRAKE